MGWSKGKGLGANLDGEQNFIRVAHKADQRGIGFQDRDDQWTQHSNEFNSLLKSLDNSKNGSRAESDNDDAEEVGLVCTGFGFASNKKKKKTLEEAITSKLSGKSLEEQSKSSKARVHYKKFTRGKDLSRYSEKDLANIFGKKEFNENAEVEPIEKEQETDEALNDCNFGITTIETGTSISDYFKNKKLKLKRGNTTEELEPEIPAVENGDIEGQAKSKKKKRKHKTPDSAGEDCSTESSAVKSEIESVPTSEESEPKTVTVENVDTDGQPKKKKKKRKHRTSESDDGACVNERLADKSTTDSNSTPIEEETAQPTSEKNKKKKKKSADSNDASATENIVDIVTVAEAALTEKKKKRKRKNDDDIKSDVNEPSEECIDKPSTSKKLKSNEVTNEQPINVVSNILSALIKNKQNLMGNSSTEADSASVDPNDTLLHMPQYISFGENIYEINRYQAEVFRFLDLDGFANANLCDLAGYGYSKNLELKVTSKVQDNNKISDLWDHALASKYGKEAVRAKKKQKYSIKTLKNKNLFKGI